MDAQLVDEFFNAPRMPVTTHEEWLLRTCHQLMHREATTISFLESQARANGMQQWNPYHFAGCA